VIDGTCSFADIDILKLSRFDGLEPDWREKRGWMPIS
jgi:sarcosine oxidase, subunit beta